MRKTGMTRWVLGALAGVAVLAGCADNGRSWAMTAPDDYMFMTSSQAGVEEGSGAGGAGLMRTTTPTGKQGMADDLWLKQDFRTPYPPAALEARVAPELGSGKPLQANERKIWVQGTYAVELASGITQVVAPESAAFQPQPSTNGDIAPPKAASMPH
jgi:hypothetical protein